MLDRARCSNCGTYPHEWIDEEGHRAYPPPFILTSARCYGCVELEDGRDLVPKGQKGVQHNFVPWTLELERLEGREEFDE